MSELRALDTQIAGHTDDDPGSENIPSFMVSPHGYVYKPVPGARGVKELEFYVNSHLLDETFRKFLPAFEKEIVVKDIKYMGIEDLTYPYAKESVCIADIKMGTRTYDDHASEDKKKNEIGKASKTTTASLGIRFCGAKVFNPVTGQVLKLSKDWGKNLTKDNILKDGLLHFFSAGTGEVNKAVVKAFLVSLEALLVWFKTNQKSAFYSSSLLFVFGPVINDHKTHHNVLMVDDKIGVSLKMIDFAHVDVISNKTDEGYIQGLSNLISMMSQLL
eukprot:gene16671-19812_t